MRFIVKQPTPPKAPKGDSNLVVLSSPFFRPPCPRPPPPPFFFCFGSWVGSRGGGQVAYYMRLFVTIIIPDERVSSSGKTIVE